MIDSVRASALGLLLALGACHQGNDGAATPDAAIADAGTDAQGNVDPGDLAGMSSDDGGTDGSSPSTVVTCGGTTCHLGQSCVSGACAFTSCTGSKVPGDYATVQSAVTALTNGGATATICLGAGTFNEMVDVAAGSLTIQGVSSTQSIITGLTAQFGDTGEIMNSAEVSTLNLVGVGVKTLTLGGSQMGPPGTATITASALDTVTISSDGVLVSATLDGDELTGAGISTDGTGGIGLLVENCYIHDAGYGLNVYNSPTEDPYITVTFLNNTFVNDQNGIHAGKSAGLSYYDNVFVDNGVALYLQVGAPAFTDGNNAYFGNTTNFDGAATGSSGDVKTDPMLDTATPPGLLAGSPCRGAADPTKAPAHDYYGRPRGTTPDIGAVQSSP